MVKATKTKVKAKSKVVKKILPLKPKPSPRATQPTIEELKAAVSQAYVDLGIADENVQAADAVYNTSLDAFKASPTTANAIAVNQANRALTAAETVFRARTLDLDAAQAALLFRLADSPK